MNNKSKILLSLLMGMLVFFSACEDKIDYDYDAIVPIVMSITGPDVVAAHGLTDFPTTFRVPYRGGSTFQWSVTTQGGRGANIVLDDAYSSIAYITFDQSSDLDVATITVVETTMGGLTSTPATRNVTMSPFCPEDMQPFAGTWNSTNPQDHDDLVIQIPPQTLNTLRISGLLGYLVEVAWAENWIPGEGGQGWTMIEFDCDNVINLPEQLLGTTFEWGPYWIRGSGTYDPDAVTMSITYQIAWSQGGATWNEFTSNLTMSKELIEQIRDLQNLPAK